MLRVILVYGWSLILLNDTIRNGTIRSDWGNSFIINIYNGEGDALIRGNYRGLKLLDRVMKGIERVMEKIIRERVFINDMKFGFMPGQGTTDAIFILRHLQEKHLAKKRKLYFAFVYLEMCSIEYQEKLFGGPCENFALRNGLCSLYSQCTTTPEVKLDPVTPTVIKFIRVQYLTLSHSSFSSRLCHVSSLMGQPGICCMLMT